MLPVIENLLVLQDRDRKIMRVEAELANLGPERTSLDNRSKAAQAQLDAAKTKVKQIETERNKLELEVQAKKGQIEKYSIQQFQTKKNEEYRALANEIENCKAAIVKLDDAQIEFMEQAEGATQELNAISKRVAEILKEAEAAKKGLAEKEVRLKRELEDLKSDYERLESAVDPTIREKYTRLRRSKGASSLVGINHGVCGGCHVKLPMQVVLSCQAQQELVVCPNCGRILYFTPEMVTTAAD